MKGISLEIFWSALLFSSWLLASGSSPESSAKPSLKISNQMPYWSCAFGEVYRILLLNLHEPEPPFSTHYVVPGPKFKKEIYLWDTAFIGQIWKWWHPEIAQEIFFPLFQIQKQGMIPHSIYQTSDSQPPLLAWSIWKIYEHTEDRAYLEKVYPHLKDYNFWFYQERRMTNGLFFWDNRYESGMDNSPRFTNRSATKVIPLRKIAAVDLCSYLVADNQALAKMAKALNKAEEAEKFQRRAEELKALINQHLWSEPDGLYYDFDFGKNELVRVKSIASLIPLFAGVPDAQRAKRLRDHIMNPSEFNTLIPLPSVSLDDQSFELDMWRGPVWINTAYLVILGLRDYGYKKEASELSWKLVEGVFKVWEKRGTFYEFYHPENFDTKGLHRKFGNLSINLSRGDAPVPDFIGWTGLVNNLVIEILFGLEKNGKQWTLSPEFPAWASGSTFSLSLPEQNLEISLEIKSPTQVLARVWHKQVLRNFELGPGKSATWLE